MQKTKKLKLPLTKSLRKMKISAGTSQAVTVSQEKPTPTDYISNLLHPDLIAKIAKDVPVRYLQNFMQVNKYVNEALRDFFPAFIKQHFIPKQVRSRAALEAAKNDAILNPNTLYRISLADFLTQVRPGLLEWQNLRENYIEKFTQLINETEDNGENQLYNLKRLALIHPEFTEEDLDMYTRIQVPSYYGRNITYPYHIDLAVPELTLQNFLTTLRPFIATKFNAEDKRQFINSLEQAITNTQNNWHRQPRNQEQWDQYEREMDISTKYDNIIISIRHPEFSEDEIIAHRMVRFQCPQCYPPQLRDYNY
jgi:hypothetical protein